MTVYERPHYYAVFHMLFGFSAVWFPIIGVLAILYQVLQFAFNIRFFPLEMVIRKGNSVEHTAVKICEIAFGYIIGKIARLSKVV